MYIPLFFEIAQNFLLFFSLLSTASAQGLTDAQIELVKRRLQEGATHRSVCPPSLYTSFVETLCCCGDLELLVFSNTRLLRWLRTFISQLKLCKTLY